MNRDEALDVLRDQMAAFTAMPFPDLLPVVGRREHLRADGASGVRYQVEIQIVWDDPSKTVIRVIGSIDDGGPLQTS